ncbi:MAG: hypothetical protein CSA45_04330 [Gammaproteobacteria bacterium]|nr:MAG: hypothetical protein CSA45_04330 [Gammaproteobacteria bacterium]
MMFIETLPIEQQKIYPLLKFAKDYHFVLFGGTAISLQIGHRVSVDFDFFSKEKLDSTLKKTILEKLQADNIIQDERDTLVYEKDGVKISFFGNIAFSTAENSFMLDEVLRVANLKALLATKLKATFDRAEYKDYKDIVELLQLKDINLAIGINKMNDFFKGNISISQILKNLTYFDDGDLHKLNKEDRKILVDHVNNYLQEQQVKQQLGE